jgi:hypothetical protein
MKIQLHAPARWASDLSLVLMLFAAVGGLVALGALVTIPYAETFVLYLVIAAGIAYALGYLVKS